MKISHRICIAPMISYTDRHFRYLMRLLSEHVFLYTEMITTGALIYGNRKKYLAFQEIEHPVGIQLGGNNPKDLAKCVQWAEQAGFDEINLNVGCPSKRVEAGEFGAVLMQKPDLVADCIGAMVDMVKIPITLKMRLGYGKIVEDQALYRFVEKIASMGCQSFIIHARAAWPNLKPAQNRSEPPLNYEQVYQLKEVFPHLEIVINGGIKTTKDINTHLEHVDGVMLGRIAYKNPWFIREIESCFWKTNIISTREEVMTHYLEYVKKEVSSGEDERRLKRHLLEIYHGLPGSKRWKRSLSGLINDD